MNAEIAAHAIVQCLPCRGVAQIVRFNWPQYVAALVVMAMAAILSLAGLPAPIWWMLLAGSACALWWLVASLAASWWIYDVSPLTRWRWLAALLRDKSRRGRMLNVHSGFDETTLRLRAVFPHAEVTSIDLYDPRRMTEPSIHRARRVVPPLPDAVGASPGQLPVDDAAIDIAWLLFAAHELRRPADRRALFYELHRILKPGGRIVLVEHARDVWNFIAFGPGCLHFLPYAEWLRLARREELHVALAGHITPLVRFLVFER